MKWIIAVVFVSAYVFSSAQTTKVDIKPVKAKCIDLCEGCRTHLLQTTGGIVIIDKRISIDELLMQLGNSCMYNNSDEPYIPTLTYNYGMQALNPRYFNVLGQ